MEFTILKKIWRLVHERTVKVIKIVIQKWDFFFFWSVIFFPPSPLLWAWSELLFCFLRESSGWSIHVCWQKHFHSSRRKKGLVEKRCQSLPTVTVVPERGKDNRKTLSERTCLLSGNKTTPQTQFSIEKWFPSEWFSSFQSFKVSLCIGGDKSHSQDRLQSPCPIFVCFS